MTLEGINWWPIVIASVANIVLGYSWFSRFLFGRVWVKLRGEEENPVIGIEGTIWLITYSILSPILLWNLTSFINDRVFDVIFWLYVVFFSLPRHFFRALEKGNIDRQLIEDGFIFISLNMTMVLLNRLT